MGGQYPPDSWEAQAAYELRARFIEFIERHEEEQHGGEPCDAERVGLLAFLAHSIGVHDEIALGYWVRFVEAIREYDEQHADHDHGGD